ncbi:pyridoxamine 5'-phosphate oxidase [Actinobacteria bacterium YIM 96077]|uniref:Pyridoxamine 5'-phosphate oxidase n=1 Tax=Phytoactinopolyspora halophila TaxID=1981511 RepID=A0A329R3E6_9ACTN|nr:pyridoxamine 5'-phosphate oxidase [Actinobacteria bacterium YIM 96077]RAW18933.1 pyridoxamine 5'-phosphate oxidase [Phytoactinopolyspora halophila]
MRALPVFPDVLPAFDPEETPEEPALLFRAWLDDAVAAGVPAPHAVTLCTVDPGGQPSARVLILKEYDESGWYVASRADSPKGRHIAANPRVALSVFWAQRGRQVRVEGVASAMDADASARDFLARSAGSRAAALVGGQSERLANPGDVTEALAAARERIEEEPGHVESSWTLYRIRASAVEFWQASHDRAHVRLRYDRDGEGWQKVRLWP